MTSGDVERKHRACTQILLCQKRDTDYWDIVVLDYFFVNKHFAIWLQIGYEDNHQPISSHYKIRLN